MEMKFGKCSSTVSNLLSNFSEEKVAPPNHFFFDILFTSFPLLYELHQRGYDGTGTFRANHLDKQCPLKSPLSFDKLDRGACHTASGRKNW